MTRVGDKFLIEVEEVYESERDELYRIKGFNSLVFDEQGIRKLQRATTSNEYQRGYAEGYERGKEISELAYKYAYRNALDEVEAPTMETALPKEDEPKATMPEIGEMEQLAKQFFDYCNGITGKGSE